MFYPDWLILRILHQSFEIERPKGHWSEVVVHLYIYISIRDYIYSVHYRDFHSLHCLFFINRDGIYVPHSNWLHTIWIYFVGYDLKEFVFSHDKAASLLKEYFRELEMDKTHIYVVLTY